MPESRYSKRPDLVSAGVAFGHLLLVLTPVWVVAIFGFGWWLPVCWLVFGLLMNGLLNLVHEAAHYHVFRRRTANDRLGRWLLGPLSIVNFDAYRQRHWDHHRHLGGPADPKVAYHQEINGRRMFYHLFSCLTLIEAIRKFLHQRAAKGDASTPSASAEWLWRTAVVQAIWLGSLFGAAWLTHGDAPRLAILNTGLAYLIVYVYGLGSLTVLAANIRAIAEHQIDTPADAYEGMAAMRNFSCNAATRLCFGAYGFGEHATHHQQPALPYYHLPRTTAALAKENAQLAPTRGYLRTIGSLMRKPEPNFPTRDRTTF